MAEILSDQYSSVFSTPLSDPVEPTTLFTNDNDASTLSDFTFDADDILCAAIEEISPNSAPGPDGFPAIFLSRCKSELAPYLYQIWRESLDQELDPCPERVKQSTICPIHKGDSTAQPKNYRPVALTSHLVKIFEKVVRKTLFSILIIITSSTPTNMDSELVDPASPNPITLIVSL